MGADDLISNDKKVAVIEYHFEDNYENLYGRSRKSYYGMMGLPTAFFDGVIEESGGYYNTSLYSTYFPLYNQRIAVPSSFTIDIEGTHSGFSEYNINVTVTIIAEADSDNLVLHFVLTESEIIKNWQNQHKLNYVERLMLPDQYGTKLDFSENNKNKVSFTFTINKKWINKNCEIVAFVQNLSTKEILQGAKKELISFGSSNTNDVSILATYCPSAVCKNTFEPTIEIANYGSVSLTTLDIVYNINNDEEHTFNWTGNLSPMGIETVTLSSINFEISENNIFNIFINNPNGQEDEFHQNDTTTANINIAKEVSNSISLALKLDDYPEEISWKLFNSNNETLYSGNNYTQAGQLIYQEFNLSQPDCYTFIIYDQGGNGLTGSGVWNLIYNSSVIIANGKNFGLQKEVQFNITNTDVTNNKLTDFKIYPNPANNTIYLSFDKLNDIQPFSVNIYNSHGKIICHIPHAKLKKGNNTFKINTSQFVTGLYYVSINYNKKYYQQKIIITK
jgi:hypothetical protein